LVQGQTKTLFKERGDEKQKRRWKKRGGKGTGPGGKLTKTGGSGKKRKTQRDEHRQP